MVCLFFPFSEYFLALGVDDLSVRCAREVEGAERNCADASDLPLTPACLGESKIGTEVLGLLRSN